MLLPVQTALVPAAPRPVTMPTPARSRHEEVVLLHCVTQVEQAFAQLNALVTALKAGEHREVKAPAAGLSHAQPPLPSHSDLANGLKLPEPPAGSTAPKQPHRSAT